MISGTYQYDMHNLIDKVFVKLRYSMSYDCAKRMIGSERKMFCYIF